MSCLVQGNVSGVMDFQEVWNEKECIEERRAPKGIEGRKMAQGSQQGQPMLNDVEFLSEGSRPLEERSVKASGTASTEWGGQQASEQNLGVVQNLNMQEFIGNETITGEQWQRVSSMACGLTEYEKEDIFPLGDECSPVGMLSPFFYRDNNEKAVELIGSSTSVDFNYFNNNDKLISCGKKVIDFF